MYIRDLTRLPANPPSPYPFPVPVQKGDRWGQGQLPEGLALIAVGWLGDFIPSQGKTPSQVISRLWAAYRSKLVISDGTAGWHDCELCQGEKAWYPGGKVGPVLRWRGRRLRVRGYGHFLLRVTETVYMAPALILHYILDHDYQPPEPFIEAVRQGEFLKTEDLLWVEADDG